MSKLLDEAIADLRSLPPEEQDRAADAIRTLLDQRGRPSYSLTDEQVVGADETLAGIDEGRIRLASNDDVQAFWHRLRT